MSIMQAIASISLAETILIVICAATLIATLKK